jgi:hypothetical protein
MLSFDISITDIALTIAIIVLFALYLTRTSKENNPQKHLIRMRKPLTQPKANQIINNQKKKPDCPHRLGYLNKQKEKSIPEECTGCPQLVQCLLPEK